MKAKKPFLKTVLGRFLCALLVLALLIAGGIGILFFTDPNGCRIFDGVTIGGMDVGGMTTGEAQKALSAALKESLYANSLTIQLPQEEITLSSGTLNASVNVRKAVSDAYAYGREETASEQNLPLLPYLKLNETGIREALEAYAARWDTQLQQPSWELSGSQPDLSTATCDPEAAGQQLVLTKGVPELQLDTDRIYDEILTACDNAISLCAQNTFSLCPDVTPLQLPEDLDMEAIHKEVSVEPVNDSLDMTTYGFVNGSYGYAFDLEAAQALYADAAQGATVSVPMVVTQPEILGDNVYFRDVLGHCETKHTDDENRNTNLRLLCEALDGVILEPGQEFSYNETVGERTEEKGYKAATAYSGKSIVKDIGGGVCQGSTTIYNCALLADLEILERVCHGATVGYVPLGLDAAVNWNTKTDLRFKNNFNFPMMIKAEVSDGYVKMKILGTDEKDYYIEMRCGNGQEGEIRYAVSYKCKYDKVTGEQISKDREAYSTYYPLG